MNGFRSTILSGATLGIRSPLASKAKRSEPPSDSLVSVTVPRHETRTVNHRDEDRHRLADEKVTIRHEGATTPAELINLSGGGAMIAATLAPKLWDPIDLIFDDSVELRSVVRWIRGGRIGLEFVAETAIGCAPGLRESILRQVIERNFPDMLAAGCPAAPEPEGEGQEAASVDEDWVQRRAAQRHSLIFSAEVHFDHESSPVRLRNISAKGALIETRRAFPADSEILLDLGAAGTIFALVNWSRGDQYGLAFRETFDLQRLVHAKATIASARGERAAGNSAWGR